MYRIKRFISIVFIAFIVSDICRYVRYYVKNDSFKILNFRIYSTTMSETRIFNLAIIYFVIVSTIYFIFNFFKNNRS